MGATRTNAAPPQSTLILVFCLALLALRLVFFPTTLATWDSGQYAENLLHLRLAHGPYVYHHLAGQLLALLWREDVALALLSTLGLAAGAVGLLGLARTLFKHDALAAVALGIYLFLPVALRFSVVQEIYALQGGLILLALAASCEGRAGWSGVFVGLAMGTHNGSVLALPAVLLPLVADAGPQSWRLRRVGRWAGAAALAYAPAAALVLWSFLTHDTRVGPWQEAHPSALAAALRYLSPGSSGRVVLPTPAVLWERGPAMLTWARRGLGLVPLASTVAATALCATLGTVALARRRAAALGPAERAAAAPWLAIFALPLTYLWLGELPYGRPVDPGLHLPFVAPTAALSLPLLLQQLLRGVRRLGMRADDPRLLDALRGVRPPLVFALVALVGFVATRDERARMQAVDARLAPAFAALRQATEALPRDGFMLTDADPHRVPYYADMRALRVEGPRDRPRFSAYTTAWGRYAVHRIARFGLAELPGFVARHQVFVSSLSRRSLPCRVAQAGAAGPVRVYRLVACAPPPTSALRPPAAPRPRTP